MRAVRWLGVQFPEHLWPPGRTTCSTSGARTVGAGRLAVGDEAPPAGA